MNKKLYVASFLITGLILQTAYGMNHNINYGFSAQSFQGANIFVVPNIIIDPQQSIFVPDYTAEPYQQAPTAEGASTDLWQENNRLIQIINLLQQNIATLILNLNHCTTLHQEEIERLNRNNAATLCQLQHALLVKKNEITRLASRLSQEEDQNRRLTGHIAALLPEHRSVETQADISPDSHEIDDATLAALCNSILND